MEEYFEFLERERDIYYNEKKLLNDNIITDDVFNYIKNNYKKKLINVIYISDNKNCFDISELYYLKNDGIINDFITIKPNGFINKKIYNCTNIFILINNNILNIERDNNIKIANNIIESRDVRNNFLEKNKYKKIYTTTLNKLLKPIIKTIIKINKKCNDRYIKLGLNDKMVGLVNVNNMELGIINELSKVMKVLSMNTYQEQYEYIYNLVCDDLDKQFSKYNLCKFTNSKCISMRHCKVKKPLIYGCCYTKGKVCEYLINSSCSIKCLSCKLFTCRYLRRNGIKYKIKDILLLDIFFNLKQKLIIDSSLYTADFDILYKLIDNK